MESSLYELNDLLVDTFNLVLKTEESALADTRLSDVTITDVHIMVAISRKTRCTMGELAQEMDVAMATLTPAIDRLTRKGYVARERGKADRRTVWVSLERKGALTARMHRLFHVRLMRDALGRLDEEERAALVSALRHLNAFFAEEAHTQKGDRP